MAVGRQHAPLYGEVLLTGGVARRFFIRKDLVDILFPLGHGAVAISPSARVGGPTGHPDKRYVSFRLNLLAGALSFM